jgi:hypothetical protein
MKIARSMAVSFIVLLGLIVGTAVLVQPVSAGIHLNTIDGTAKLLGNGQRVIVTGPIGCDKGEDIEIRIWVFQGEGAAKATGSWHGRCSGYELPGDEQHWKVNASANPGLALTVGNARVHAVAITSVKGIPTEPIPHDWWNNDVRVERSGHENDN